MENTKQRSHKERRWIEITHDSVSGCYHSVIICTELLPEGNFGRELICVIIVSHFRNTNKRR